jgi:NADPH-dependent glutamate synthase beta subunit-like oxidoreductase/NAD-dependent dihydropyrimidine dehydrogenase PreA subunit
VGLSAAHDLALMGYSVSIFEAAAVAGGMLCLGIPEYRLPRSVVEAQVREILDLGGITLKLNHAAGRDFTVSGLRREGFDAVVIAVGAHRSRDLSIPGIEMDGVLKGIDFLLNSNLGYRFSIGKRVVVIGGGNVAMDVARSAAREVIKQHAGGLPESVPSEENIAAVATHEMMDVSLSALRMGAREVNIVCLERRDEMPAALEEIEEAETEGIVMHAGFGPKQVLGRNGSVAGLQVIKTKWVFDSTGRFNPAFYDNSESVIDCDTVILAIGQTTKLDFLLPEDGVEVSPRGLIVADRQSLQTTAPGIFAGGDCVFGPRLIIDSVGDGKRIAIGIDQYLRGTKHPDPEIEVEVLERHQMSTGYMELARQAVPMLPIDRRTGVTEVEIGYDEEAAVAEASRCLRCWINTVFEGNDEDGSRCILCGGCVDVCPEDCLQLVPLSQIEFPDDTVEHVRNNVELYAVELDDVAAEELGVITGSAMLKDETKCIRCGLCAARCPVNVITMEAYHWVVKSPTGLIPPQSLFMREAVAK